MFLLICSILFVDFWSYNISFSFSNCLSDTNMHAESPFLINTPIVDPLTIALGNILGLKTDTDILHLLNENLLGVHANL